MKHNALTSVFVRLTQLSQHISCLLQLFTPKYKQLKALVKTNSRVQSPPTQNTAASARLHVIVQDLPLSSHRFQHETLNYFSLSKFL